MQQKRFRLEGKKDPANNKGNADCEEAVEFPPLETFENNSDEKIPVRQEPGVLHPAFRCDLFRPLPLL